VKLSSVLLAVLPQGDTGIWQHDYLITGEIVILSGPAFAAFMNCILKVKIVFRKRKQNCDLILHDNFIYQNFKGRIDCGKL
jgi:hypothetical protein